MDRTSAEPIIHDMTATQLVRKTARRKKGGIEIEGCGIWVIWDRDVLKAIKPRGEPSQAAICEQCCRSWAAATARVAGLQTRDAPVRESLQHLLSCVSRRFSVEVQILHQLLDRRFADDPLHYCLEGGQILTCFQTVCCDERVS